MIQVTSGNLIQTEIYPKTENLFKVTDNNITFVNEDKYDWMVVIS